MFLINLFTTNNKNAKDGLSTVYVDDLSPDEEWGPIDPSMNGQICNSDISSGIYSDNSRSRIGKIVANIAYDAKFIASNVTTYTKNACKKSFDVITNIRKRQ